MKIRTGFVSNSSSSSFIIISKKGKLTAEMLIDVFQVGKGSPLRGMAEEMAGTLINTAEKIKDKQSYYEEFGIYGDKVVEKAFKNNHKVYCGSVNDQDGDINNVLCMVDLHYEDENVIIEKEGGY